MYSSRDIPATFREQVKALPEYAYGATIIGVTLDDGSVIKDVHVAWGREIFKVGASAILGFDPARIVSVARQ